MPKLGQQTFGTLGSMWVGLKGHQRSIKSQRRQPPKLNVVPTSQLVLWLRRILSWNLEKQYMGSLAEQEFSHLSQRVGFIVNPTNENHWRLQSNHNEGYIRMVVLQVLTSAPCYTHDILPPTA